MESGIVLNEDNWQNIRCKEAITGRGQWTGLMGDFGEAPGVIFPTLANRADFSE